MQLKHCKTKNGAPGTGQIKNGMEGFKSGNTLKAGKQFLHRAFTSLGKTLSPAGRHRTYRMSCQSSSCRGHPSYLRQLAKEGCTANYLQSHHALALREFPPCETMAENAAFSETNFSFYVPTFLFSAEMSLHCIEIDGRPYSSQP